MKTVTVLLLTLCTAGLMAAQDSARNASEERLFKSFEEVLEQVVSLRQLDLKRPVDRGIKTKDEIRGYLMGRLAETYHPEEIAQEAQVLKRLGLIPDDMVFGDFIVELMTEQVAGYYDPYAGTFYIADWIDPQIQRPVMAHELTHALQDQHYDLKPFLERIEGNDDRTLARSAVVEGDGLAVMLQYMLAPMGIDFRTLPSLEQMSQQQSSLMESQFPVFAGAPPYLQESLLFPYTTGAAFLQGYLKQRDWAELDSIYKDMPVSTEQILHPEKYFGTRDEPGQVPDNEPVEGGQVVYRNVLGEFTLRMVLETQVEASAAATAAAGWDGDRIELIEHDGVEILRLTTVWDTEEDASEFCEAYQSLLSRKLGGPPAASGPAHSEGQYSWTDSTRPATLTCGATQVTVREHAPITR